MPYLGGKTWLLFETPTYTLTFSCPTRGKKPPSRTEGEITIVLSVFI